MKTFLNQIADYLYENHQEDLGEVCIVFPNRRAGLYLKKYLSEKFNKNIWLPQIFAIEDFISNLSSVTLVDNLTLIFELHEIHRDIEGTDAKSFEDFLTLGDVILHDFNEIDLYLADPKGLFSYLSDAKAISLWNLDGRELTDFQRNYLKFYNLLFEYYSRLNDRLKSNNVGYQGKLYRFVAENIPVLISDVKWKKVIFAGFNALTSSEEQIIRQLQKEGLATVLWDMDSYYVENEVQEAGKFIRSYLSKWNETKFLWNSSHFKTSAKNIDIIGVPMKLGQAKYVGNILTDILNKNGVVENTAVVLSDENLLFPVLNAIPPEIEAFNLTMGLPFKTTLLYNLLDSIIILHENRYKLSKIGKTRNGFYYKDIINVLDNSLIKNYFESENIANSLKLSNRLYYSSTEIQHKFIAANQLENNLFLCIFQNWDNDKVAIKHLNEIIQIFKSKFECDTAGKFDLEILYNFSKTLHQLSQYIENKQINFSISAFRKLFKRIIANQTIPFYGEPLEGLQVMGMLETRTLDFKNIILLSVNEGVLPASKSFNSFIPIDIKKLFGLPDYTDKDAVFAYHFYRLLQRAENVNILYNTEPDEFSDGDKSRFIYQIINELPKYNSQIHIRELLLNINSDIKENQSVIEIKKEIAILKKLNQIAVNGFSASKLNDYINCSLQFYFKHIADISETDETEEVIQANTLGNVVHEVLAELYKPLIDKVLISSDIESLLPLIDEFTDIHFAKLYKDGDVSFGINLLTVKMSKMYIRNLMLNEISYIKKLASENQYLTIKMLEKKLECIIDCQSEDIPLIKLKGFVDRVDNEGGVVRIVDYKTGKVEQKNLTLDEPELLLTDINYAKSLQLLIYALLFKNENPDYSQTLKTGIISLRNQMKGFMSLFLKGNDYLNTSDIQYFESLLIVLFKEIFDKDVSFVQTTKEENCVFCKYKEICGR